MKGKKGFTLIELILAMVIISAVIAYAIPTIRFYQRETIQARIDGDLSLISAALNVYQSHKGAFPEPINYQNQLINSSPAVLSHPLFDPFSKYGNTPYIYRLSENKKYYLVYSIGVMGSTLANISNNGRVTFVYGIPTIEKWISNGSL
jgi:prepilin-type N-terminal cleavage/methylation domain-containing protein